MTMNDVHINSHCLRIRGIAKRLSAAQADGRLSELWKALGDIHEASREALWRMNDLHYGRDYPQNGAERPHNLQSEKERVKP